jgi:hypothetical protein
MRWAQPTLVEDDPGRFDLKFMTEVTREIVVSADHGLVLRNAIAWAHNEEQPLIAQGKGVLDVSLWMQKSSVTAHLVNLTNPMMMKGPVREIPPSPQQVRVRPPEGAN